MYARLVIGSASPSYAGQDGFEKVRSYDDPSGLRAEVYRNGYTWVVVFIGTEPGDLRDAKADFLQAIGLVSAQYAAAVEIAFEVTELAESMGGEVEFTGHSLGGGLAASAAAHTGGTGIGFNAAALHADTIKGASMSGFSFVNYQSTHDVLKFINAMTPNAAVPGTTVPVSGAGTHGMAAMCKALGC